MTPALVTNPSVLDAQALLTAIVEGSQDGILAHGTDGIVLSRNPGAQQIYGYVAGEIVGQPISKIIPPERASELPAIYKRLAHDEFVHT